MKPYTIESYKAGKTPMTRAGVELTQFAYFEHSEQPFVFTKFGESCLFSCYPNGGYLFDRRESVNDLFEAPVKREGWINVYASGEVRIVSAAVHPTKESAIAAMSASCKLLTTIKIEWED